MKNNASQNPMVRVMGLRDFRLLFGGTATSLLGDQLFLVASPWLVMKLTNDPLALGIVLALEGIPRALFMLVGGAITDRFSPRIVMLASDILRFFLTTLMALAVFTGTIEMWMMYLFGLGFGLVAGFAIPAQNSIVPMLVDDKDLQAGNSIMMGITQLITFVGPTLAGVLIGLMSDSTFSIGLAIAIDAVTFVVSALCLWLIRTGQRVNAGESSKESVWTAIVIGIKYVWNDQALRLLFIVLAAINFCFAGPLLVGIPVLASQRLPEGAIALGVLLSAMSGGNLVGYLLAGALPRPNGSILSAILLGLLVGLSFVVAAFGFINSTWLDFGLMLAVGIGMGYVQILMFTWMQTRTPKEMLGRLMSMIMLAGTGLLPLSQAISGAVMKWSVEWLFVGAGALLLLVALWAMFQPGLKIFSGKLAEEPGVRVTETV